MNHMRGAHGVCRLKAPLLYPYLRAAVPPKVQKVQIKRSRQARGYATEDSPLLTGSPTQSRACCAGVRAGFGERFVSRQRCRYNTAAVSFQIVIGPFNASVSTRR